MLDEKWEREIREKINLFPKGERDKILHIWNQWLDSNPVAPYYESWIEFASHYDDSTALYTDTRVYIKRVRNELKNFEIPKSNRQRVAEILAAIAGVFVLIFVTISRFFSSSE